MSHDATAAARDSIGSFIPNGFQCPLENPNYFIFPTSLGDLDIDQMNRLFATGIFPIGLSNKPLMVDGRLMYPDQFFRHDLVHMKNESATGTSDITLNRACEIKDKVIEKIDILGDENLKQLFKMIFFIMTHELPNQIGKIDKYLTTDLKGQLQRAFNPWESTMKSDFLYRSDWYKDHFPDPKSLGLDSMEELWASGLKAFDQLLIGDTPTTPLEKTNTPTEEIVTMVLPANFCNPKRQEERLTKGELTSYNKIVSWINEGCPEENKPQKTLSFKVFTVLSIQGVSDLLP